MSPSGNDPSKTVSQTKTQNPARKNPSEAGEKEGRREKGWEKL